MTNKRNILFYPFSVIFGVITGLRNFLYNSGILHSHKFSLPVICVGNITVGGTGKTPHTEYLIDLLKYKFRVATLSRGYKRKSKGFRIASAAMNVSDLGDEPFQIFSKHPDITVAVDRDRVHGVNLIIRERPETEVIILDDGFQHRRITPGLNLLLTDFSRIMTKDFILPYGELRESISNMRRADVIVVTKSPDDISQVECSSIITEMNIESGQKVFFTALRYSSPQFVFKETNQSGHKFSSQENKTNGAVLVTGIANPLHMKEYIGSFFSEIIHLRYPDHHKFSGRDIQKISNAFESLKSPLKSVVTTEKDAVRLREFSNISEPVRKSFFYVPVSVHFLNNGKDDFDTLIHEYVRKTK